MTKIYNARIADDRMVNFGKTEKIGGEDTNIRDGVRGTVTGGCSKGIFLDLEDGQEAFARFGGLNTGTTVLCTVLKKATENWRVLVSIDSVENVVIV